jgi:hypothetical protein
LRDGGLGCGGPFLLGRGRAGPRTGLHARCRKPHCRLAKTLTVERVKDRAVIRFSKMFTDYNMLFMGRDLLEKSLEELGRRIARQLPELNGLKPHTTHQ